MAQVKVGSRSNGFFQLIQLSDYVFWVTCEVMELKFPVRILPLLPQLLLILTIICFTENLPLLLLLQQLLLLPPTTTIITPTDPSSTAVAED